MATGTPSEVILVGANPGVRLFDDNGDVVGYASVWLVDWSTHGKGEVIVVWHNGQVRVLSPDPELAYWLTQDFTRHFPEVKGLPWPEPKPDHSELRVERAEVSVSLDPYHGMVASARDVTVKMSGTLDRRVYATDSFDLGGAPHGLSLVLIPTMNGSIMVQRDYVPGNVLIERDRERPSSSAFLAIAEVWRR
ncbi:MAG: hypothetical protein ACRDT8_19425 [Micromonosporaceae bacterium]